MRWILALGLIACGRVGFAELGDDARVDSSRDATPVEIVPITSAGYWQPVAELRRTLAVSVSRTKLTFSSWYKSSDIGTMPVCAGTTPSEQTFIWSDLDDPPGMPMFQHVGNSIGPNYSLTNPWPYAGQWVHLVVSVDTDQPVLGERVRWWINGERVATKLGSSGSDIAVGQQLYLGDTVVHTIGNKWTGSFEWSGWLAETYLIWGHALDASAFVTVLAPAVVRSIRYTGPIEPESVYFKYPAGGSGGDNAFSGQPDWAATSMSHAFVDLPY